MQMNRYLSSGCVFAEDLGSDNSSLTYTGTTLIKSPFGQAREFNGSGDYVSQSPNNVNINNTDFTILARIYLVNNTTQSANRICKINGSVSFGVDKSTRKIGSYVNVGGTAVGNWNDGPVISADTWVDVAVIFNNTTLTKTYYINGVEQNTVNVGVAVTGTNDGLITIGGVNGAFNKWFSGYIKDVIVDDRMWSTQELLNYTNNKVFDYDKNIISRWNLDATDTVKDLGWKELGNDGTVNGNPTLEDSPFGKCLKLDGTGDFIDAGVHTEWELIPYQDQTFSIFIKAENADSSGRIIYDNRSNLFGNVRGYFIDVKDSKVRFAFYPQVPNGQDYLYADIEINKWYHVAVSLNRVGLVSLYIDGDLKDSTDISSDAAKDLTNNANFIMGYKSYSSSSLTYFVGCLAKPIVLNKALSNIEVKDLMNRQLRGEL